MTHDHATQTAPDHITRREHERITRKNLIYSLATGLVLGIFAGAPLGWFAHNIYYQHRTGQVLLCRQRHLGQSEAELKAICGPI